jgi:hypothetical protein
MEVKKRYLCGDVRRGSLQDHMFPRIAYRPFCIRTLSGVCRTKTPSLNWANSPRNLRAQKVLKLHGKQGGHDCRRYARNKLYQKARMNYCSTLRRIRGRSSAMDGADKMFRVVVELFSCFGDVS